MLNKKDIRQGDVGTIFEVLVQDEEGNTMDLSSATTLEIWLQRRDGSASPAVDVKPATLVTDGTDGLIEYTVLLNSELDYVGKWFRQGYVVLPDGAWATDLREFKVGRRLVAV